MENRERERKENDNRINIGRNIYSDYAENVCEKAFDRKPAGTAVQVMVWAAFYIISNVTTYFFELPSWLNMVIFSVSFFGVLTWII